MWEAIISNRRRSRLMIMLMGALLVTLGFAIGMTVEPRFGGAAGAVFAVILWFILWMVALFDGDDILLSTAGAHQIEKDDSPRLWNVVEEMTIASGLPVMPAIYICEDDVPNAFAVGRKPEKAALVVTSGLLRKLTRDELQGVIAHEIGHIRNLDIRFMTMAAVMVGSITILTDVFFRSLRFGAASRRTSRGRGGGQAQLIIFLIAIIVAILAPICARLLYFACSRRREYLADASSARFTRYPEGLASALEKIAGRVSLFRAPSRVMAPLYIVNPLDGPSGGSLFATHPPTQSRIQILRAMAGGAGFLDYETAYRKVQGTGRQCLNPQTIGSEKSLPARAPNPEPEPAEEKVARSREVGNLLGRIAQFLYIPCACGVNMKVPPEFKHESVTCPRCGVVHPVPKTQELSAQEKSGKGSGKEPALRYERKGAGWESFRCSCGQVNQIGPNMSAPFMRCMGCKRKIELAGSAAENISH